MKVLNELYTVSALTHHDTYTLGDHTRGVFPLLSQGRLEDL